MAERRGEEEQQLMREFKQFRQFAAEIDSCLELFAKSGEWSDFVTACAKVIKVVQKPEFCEVTKVGNLSVIPQKAMLSRRLAQCCNPELPSGVHKNALLAYRVILSRIGHNQLAEDLNLWSAGLFALFPHANTDNKESQIKLIKDMYVPLGRQLCPCLSGLIMSLLAGIEDEQTTFYEATFALYDQIRMATSTAEFFQSMWWVLGSSATSRQALIGLLDRQLSSQLAMGAEGIRSIIYPKGVLVLRGLSAALEDPSILVQRRVLDLMLSHFPLGSEVLSEEEWPVLIYNSLKLYARRDLSLTRRLHSWLLGSSVAPSPEDPNGSELEEPASCKFIIPAVSRFLAEVSGPDNTSGATLPFRVLRALMERGEMVLPLTTALSVPLLLSVRDAKRSLGVETSASVRQSSMVANANSAGKNVNKEKYQFAVATLRDLDPQVVWFSLSHFLLDQWPNVQGFQLGIDATILYLNEMVLVENPSYENADQLQLALPVLSTICHACCNEVEQLRRSIEWGKLTPNMASADMVTSFKKVSRALDVLPPMLEFIIYRTNALGPRFESTASYMVTKSNCGRGPLRDLCLLLSGVVRVLKREEASGSSQDSIVVGGVQTILQKTVALMCTLFTITRKEDVLALSNQKEVQSQEGKSNGSGILVETSDDWLSSLFECCETKDALVSCVGIKTLLETRDLLGHDNVEMRWPVCGSYDWSGLASMLFRALDDGKAGKVAARLFFLIHRIDPRSCKSVISGALLGEIDQKRKARPSDEREGGGAGKTTQAQKLTSISAAQVAELEKLQSRRQGYSRFTKLWHHAGERALESEEVALVHGLMLTLDALTDSDQNLQLEARSFVQGALFQPARVLDPLLRMMLQLGDSTYGLVDVQRINHAIDRLQSIISCAYDRLRATAGIQVSDSIQRLDKQWVKFISEASTAGSESNGQSIASPDTKGGKSFKKSTVDSSVNEVWLRQLTNAGALITFLPPSADYLNAITIITARYISADFSLLAASESATLRSVAAECIQTLLRNEQEVEQATQLVQLIAPPVLVQMQEALSEDDCTTQVKLLELLTTMLIKTDGGLMQVQGNSLPELQANLNLARQLFVRAVLSGLEHSHPSDSPANEYWMSFATRCLAFHRNNHHLELFVIPVLTSLCKRIVSHCRSSSPLDEAATSQLCNLVRAVGVVFKRALFQQSAQAMGSMSSFRTPGFAPETGQTYGDRAWKMLDIKKWSMFSGQQEESVVAVPTDASLDILIKLLVPPGWIPESAGTCSVFGALLLAWEYGVRELRRAHHSLQRRGTFTDIHQGSSKNLHQDSFNSKTFDPAPSASDHKARVWGDLIGVESLGFGGYGARAEAMLDQVRMELMELVHWLFTIYPLQTLAAILQVWESDTSKGRKKTRHQYLGDVKRQPLSCQISVEIMLRLSARGGQEEGIEAECWEDERILVKCCELILQAVRRKRNDISLKLKFSEVAAVQFMAAYLSSRKAVDPQLKALPAIAAAFKEASTASDIPQLALDLLATIDFYIRRCGSFADKPRERGLLQDCIQHLVNASMNIAAMSLDSNAPPPSLLTRTLDKFGVSSDKARGSENGGEPTPPVPEQPVEAKGSAPSGIALQLLDAKHKLGLRALTTLAQHLATVLEKGWQDAEEPAIVSKIVQDLKPFIRARTTSMVAHSQEAVKVLASLKHPMFVKLWRTPVRELFNEDDFFQMGVSSGDEWAQLVDIVMAQEAGALKELLETGQAGNVATAVFQHLTISSDTKYRQHSLLLKRISFVLLAGEVDQYVEPLKNILETFLNSLKLEPSPSLAQVYTQVFLGFRIILVRFSNLTSFWPVVLAEVMRIIKDTAKPDADPSLAYSALKFIDLALCLQPEEFQAIQWAFVPDVSALIASQGTGAHGPAGQGSENIFQHLANTVMLPGAEVQINLSPPAQDSGSSGLKLRRPLLRVSRIETREQLVFAAKLLGSYSSVNISETSGPDNAFILQALKDEFDEYLTERSAMLSQLEQESPDLSHKNPNPQSVPSMQPEDESLALGSRESSQVFSSPDPRGPGPEPNTQAPSKASSSPALAPWHQMVSQMSFRRPSAQDHEEAQPQTPPSQDIGIAEKPSLVASTSWRSLEDEQPPQAIEDEEVDEGADNIPDETQAEIAEALRQRMKPPEEEVTETEVAAEEGEGDTPPELGHSEREHSDNLTEASDTSSLFKDCIDNDPTSPPLRPSLPKPHA